MNQSVLEKLTNLKWLLSSRSAGGGVGTVSTLARNPVELSVFPVCVRTRRLFSTQMSKMSSVHTEEGESLR